VSTLSSSKEERDLKRKQVSEGIDLLLAIFQKVGQRLFPRNIMTKQLGRQIRVYSKEQIMYWYEQSCYEDCRISAFPAFYSKTEEYDYENGIGINLLTPSILFVDLDSQDFISGEDMDKWLQRILENVSSILYGIKPLVLWSGNGYHIIIPLNSPEALEQYEDFRPYTKQPSIEFLRFAKDFLSCSKADKRHSPSFKSCLLRVPFTINSKSIKQEVRIVKVYDSTQQLSNIDRLLKKFQQYLLKNRSRFDISNKPEPATFFHVEHNGRFNSIPYVDKLICLPISDHRKFAISLILAPYCLNIKHMSEEESFQTIKHWTLRSDRLRKLEPSIEYFDRLMINTIKRCRQSPEIKPLNFENTLKHKNLALYSLLL
jgi:hypothetical protein